MPFRTDDGDDGVCMAESWWGRWLYGNFERRRWWNRRLQRTGNVYQTFPSSFNLSIYHVHQRQRVSVTLQEV